MAGHLGFSLMFIYFIPVIIWLAVAIIGFYILGQVPRIGIFLLFILLLIIGYLIARFVSILGYGALVLMRYAEIHPSMGIISYGQALKKVKKQRWHLMVLTLYSEFNILSSAFGIFYEIPVIIPHIVIDGESVNSASWRVEKYVNRNLELRGDLKAGIAMTRSARQSPGDYIVYGDEIGTLTTLLLFPIYSRPYRRALYQDIDYPVETYLILFSFIFSLILILYYGRWELLLLYFPLGILATAYIRVRNIDMFLELFELCRPTKSKFSLLWDYRKSRRYLPIDRPVAVHVETLDVDAPPEIFKCPSCGTQLDESITKCPRCGEIFQRTVVRTENVRICPQCEFPNPKHARHCKMCATKLVDSEAS
jgi:uncharacterized C2H2 Zn-finger protein